MKRIFCLIVLCLLPVSALADPVPSGGAAVAAAPFRPDAAYQADARLLDRLQRDTFRYIWEDGCPVSGMAYESSEAWDIRPVAVGGTGFGIAAIVVAADRGWITREQALIRLRTIALFLRDKTSRRLLHGAFPHWINGKTGETLPFGKNDTGADIVETAFGMQGLLVDRA
ncbi:MAG: beta-glucosidase, partial [Deltaproteobacteria bacterium]|nr:beta-glucosidase [Deltaproteobacteria bacterium]